MSSLHMMDSNCITFGCNSMSSSGNITPKGIKVDSGSRLSLIGLKRRQNSASGDMTGLLFHIKLYLETWTQTHCSSKPCSEMCNKTQDTKVDEKNYSGLFIIKLRLLILFL